MPKSGIYSHLNKYVQDVKVIEQGLRKIVSRADFSDQFRGVIMRYKHIEYNINVMRQSACLVINPITADGFASFFNCTPFGHASDAMMGAT